jgi:hypothetical protein
MVMMTVRELFSANAVIPFTFGSFCPRGYQDYANSAQILLGMMRVTITVSSV